MRTKIHGWKNETECTNRGRVYLYHDLIGEAAFNCEFDLQINNSRYLFDLKFVINGKGISLHKEIKYMKRNKSF